MAMMISWVKPVNPSHPYLENDPAPSFDPHHLRISPWLQFSIIPTQNPAMVARRSSPVDCHCWHRYRQSFANATIKAVPETINTLTAMLARRLRPHHEHDSGFNRLADQWMTQSSISRAAQPNNAHATGISAKGNIPSCDCVGVSVPPPVLTFRRPLRYYAERSAYSPAVDHGGLTALGACWIRVVNLFLKYEQHHRTPIPIGHRFGRFCSGF